MLTTLHHLYDEPQDVILELLSECEKRLATRIWFINSALPVKSASRFRRRCNFCFKANLDDLRTHLTIQTIGHDKLNQLRHVRYFKDIHGIETQMKKACRDSASQI